MIEAHVLHDIVNLIYIDIILLLMIIFFLDLIILLHGILCNASIKALQRQPLLRILRDGEQSHLRFNTCSSILTIISILWLMFVAQFPKLVSLLIQRGLSGPWIARVIEALLVSSHSHGHLLRDLQFIVQVAVVVGIADISICLFKEFVGSALVFAIDWCQSLYQAVLPLVL